jgi:hypothetical protein
MSVTIILALKKTEKDTKRLKNEYWNGNAYAIEFFSCNLAPSFVGGDTATT